MEKAIRAALADMLRSEAGVSKSELEEIVKVAIIVIPQPESGLTSAEAEQIAHSLMASIPPPANYAKFSVNNAIGRYETQGSTPLSPTTAARRASAASGTCSSSTRTILSSGP